ncbi:MAG: hypothetical protein WAW37_03620 [Syntrophobacteraceae bacterium]
MKAIVEKLINLERRMAEEKGPFTLFALFLREEAPNVWDLVVAADWITEKPAALTYVADKVSKTLSPDEIVKLSRIVILDQDNPGMDDALAAIEIEHGKAEIRNSNFFGLDIKHAYIITSRRDGLPTPEGEPRSTPGPAVLQG